MDFAHRLPDEEGVIALFRSWRGLFDGDRDRHYLITTRDGDRVVGNSGTHLTVRGKAREVGYWIRSDAAGQGYATEAVGAIAAAEMTWMGHDRLDLFIEPDNVASHRVAEKLGFAREGLLRGRIPWSAGGPDRDAVVWSLHRADWDGHPLQQVPFDAFDLVGRPLPR